MKKLSAFAKGNGLLLHTHFLPREIEKKRCYNYNKVLPIEYLKNTGWLNSKMSIAHGVNLKKDDIVVANIDNK